MISLMNHHNRQIIGISITKIIKMMMNLSNDILEETGKIEEEAREALETEGEEIEAEEEEHAGADEAEINSEKRDLIQMETLLNFTKKIGSSLNGLFFWKMDLTSSR